MVKPDLSVVQIEAFLKQSCGLIKSAKLPKADCKRQHTATCSDGLRFPVSAKQSDGLFEIADICIGERFVVNCKPGIFRVADQPVKGRHGLCSIPDIHPTPTCKQGVYQRCNSSCTLQFVQHPNVSARVQGVRNQDHLADLTGGLVCDQNTRDWYAFLDPAQSDIRDQHIFDQVSIGPVACEGACVILCGFLKIICDHRLTRGKIGAGKSVRYCGRCKQKRQCAGEKETSSGSEYLCHARMLSAPPSQHNATTQRFRRAVTII